MRKAIIALAAMATTVVASIGDAQAQRRNGGAVAAGVIGGIAAGALIGGAIASSRPAYGYPAYGYPAYAEPVYVAPPRGCWAEQEYWSNRWQAYVIRRVQVPCY